MTDKTPEALELAARFERHARYHGQDEQAAALLRRQHQRIEALEKALRSAVTALDAIGADMTVGERWTNAGQHLLDALSMEEIRALLSTTQQEDSQS